MLKLKEVKVADWKKVSEFCFTKEVDGIQFDIWTNTGALNATAYDKIGDAVIAEALDIAANSTLPFNAADLKIAEFLASRSAEQHTVQTEKEESEMQTGFDYAAAQAQYRQRLKEQAKPDARAVAAALLAALDGKNGYDELRREAAQILISKGFALEHVSERLNIRI